MSMSRVLGIILSLLWLPAWPQDGQAEKRKEFERRFAEVCRQAAAMHVELAQWLEKQGQMAWAKYQYEWALQVSPEYADAKAALAREGVKWENKHGRFEDVDKSVVKWKILAVSVQDSPDGKYVRIEQEFANPSDRPIYFFYNFRKKSNSFINPKFEVMELKPKQKSGAITDYSEDKSEGFAQFKDIDTKDIEIVFTKVLAKDLIYPKFVSETVKQFSALGSNVALEFLKLAESNRAWGFKDEALRADYRCLVYDRDNAKARQDLGCEKVDHDFGLKMRGEDEWHELTAPPRWAFKEELEFRRGILGDAAKEEAGVDTECRQQPAKASEYVAVYNHRGGTKEELGESVRLLTAVAKYLERCLGEEGYFKQTKLCSDPEPFDMVFPRISPPKEFLRRKAHARLLEGPLFHLWLNKFKFPNRPGNYGAYGRFGVELVFMKAITGYGQVFFWDQGTRDTTFKMHDDAEYFEVPVWQDRVREAVTLGNYLRASTIIGQPVSTLVLDGQLQLWSFFQFLILKCPEQFWRWIKEYSEHRNEDQSGLASFRKVFGWTLDEFELHWRQFVMENY